MGFTVEIFELMATVSTLGLLFGAAAYDVCFRTLPDKLSIGLLVCGAVRHVGSGDVLAAAMAGVAIFVASLLAWRVGFLGGGDAKLLGSVALAVPIAALPDLLLGTALAGGALAVVFLALRPFVAAGSGNRPIGLLRRVRRIEAWRLRRGGPLPYAVAIAVGGTTSLLAG